MKKETKKSDKQYSTQSQSETYKVFARKID
jgi:hypothetical protein